MLISWMFTGMTSSRKPRDSASGIDRSFMRKQKGHVSSQALRQWLEQLLEGSCSRKEHGLKGLVWSITLSAAEVEQETFQIVSATIELVSHGLKLVGCHASQPAFLLDLNRSPSLCSFAKVLIHKR